jgi:plasmid maintenance system antidote protein VapI
MRKHLSISNRLLIAIRDSNESHASISKGCGIAQPVLSRFCAGKRDITLRTAQKLMDYFKLRIT